MTQAGGTAAAAPAAAPADAAAADVTTAGAKRPAPQEEFADAERPEKAIKTSEAAAATAAQPAAAAIAAAAAAKLPPGTAAAVEPDPPATPEVSPEEKELLEMLDEASTIEYEHGPPGDNVKVTASSTILDAAIRRCNLRQNQLKARGRKTLTGTNVVEEYLGSTGEVIGYDRTTLTVKVKMARDGRDLMIPTEAVGTSGERWLEKRPEDDKPKPAVSTGPGPARPPGTMAANAATAHLTPGIMNPMMQQQMMMQQQQMVMQQQMMMRQQMMGGWPGQQMMGGYMQPNMMMGGYPQQQMVAGWPGYPQQQMAGTAGGSAAAAAAPAAAPAPATRRSGCGSRTDEPAPRSCSTGGRPICLRMAFDYLNSVNIFVYIFTRESQNTYAIIKYIHIRVVNGKGKCARYISMRRASLAWPPPA
jgi:hypothetical protein